MKVAVTGSSGLIGTALVASLRSDGHQVIRLVRQAPRLDDEVRWDPRAADAGLGAEHGALRAGVEHQLGGDSVDEVGHHHDQAAPVEPAQRESEDAAA